MLPVFVRRIAVIGSGYVCLTTESCLASLRHRVMCADVDEGQMTRLNLLDADVMPRVDFGVRGVGGLDRPRFPDPLQVRPEARK
jgi:UDP-glucose/GDP-mannose dehydrogenase family, NAD binding domain